MLPALGRQEQALDHYRQALAIAVTNNDPVAESYCWNIESLSASRRKGDRRVLS
jgi:hypothetical protein